MALQQYINDTRDLLHDSRAIFWGDDQLTRYINLARSQTAVQSGCINVLIPGVAPFGGQAVAGQFIPGGATPGMPATTTFQTIPTVEKYSFAFGNAYVKNLNQNLVGVSDVVSVSVSWGGIRPSLDWMPWEDLQAYARSYNIGVTSYPFIFSTNGDGNNGQVWLFPTPTNQLEMEWQVFAIPGNLYADSDYEAIPGPWTNYVPFYAAYLAYLNSQRFGQAMQMLNWFYQNSGLSRVSADRGKTKSFYPNG